ncbi:ATP-binding cassette domain-containing protein [Actinokineospora spheciospongiae]|uniref:ATP-binding cassette domain-containing protein n=1 Tax=Actinokineospora spheciospongiae TaxID=909613 RepID=UPI000D715F43|nr:ABC transporter ATP-binding protein [Actinokineospora spheciospongiae]PWW67049.1 ABC-type multidrug transport system ATPase subunit [Actinokineospora spheciospongiae]
MRLRGVGKRYSGGRPVLRGVDLDLVPGEVLAVTGGNGSGKSTLLRIVVGATRPSSGRVLDRPRQVGYVPERFPSDERLTARSYLAHMGRLRGLGTAEAVERGSGLLDRLALVGGADTPLRGLSKGNLQKVAVAQALVVPPALLALDEPWSGLDRAAHGVLGEVIAEVAAEGGAVVFTDHRESVVAITADRVCQVREGRASVVDVDPADRVAVTRVVLRPPRLPGPPLADPLLRGVFDARDDGGLVVVRVAGEHADGFLLAALRQGWSVVRVDEAARAHRPEHGGLR